MARILRIGTLSHIGTVDVRSADDSVSSMVLKEIYETPYALPNGPEHPEPLLLAEPLRLQFRAEFANLFNQVNFGNPVANLSSTTYGRITGSDSGRSIQFALKYLW